jgi:hypothetical protein
MMEFQIGDEVKVKQDLTDYDPQRGFMEYGGIRFSHMMKRFRGRPAVITDVKTFKDIPLYRLDTCGDWPFPGEMLQRRTKHDLVDELRLIQGRVAKIYAQFGNLKECIGDKVLMADIKILEKKVN